MRLKPTKMHFSLIQSPRGCRKQLAQGPHAGSAAPAPQLGTELRKKGASAIKRLHLVVTAGRVAMPKLRMLAAVITRAGEGGDLL